MCALLLPAVARAARTEIEAGRVEVCADTHASFQPHAHRHFFTCTRVPAAEMLIKKQNKPNQTKKHDTKKLSRFCQ